MKTLCKCDRRKDEDERLSPAKLALVNEFYKR